MCAGTRRARARYWHWQSSKSAAAGSCQPASNEEGAAALPHAASTDVLLPLCARDDTCNSPNRHDCTDAAFPPDCTDMSGGGSSGFGSSSQQDHCCLRHRTAAHAAGSGDAAAAAPAPHPGDDAVAATEGGVAAMAFKESQQEVRWPAAVHCLLLAKHTRRHLLPALPARCRLGGSKGAAHAQHLLGQACASCWLLAA